MMKKGKIMIVLACILTLALALFTGCGGNDKDEIKEISLASAPTKTEYLLGEELDLAGAMIKIEMTSGATSEIAVTAEMVSGYDKTKTGAQTVAVVYEQTEMSFTVTVTDPAKEITLSSAPTKTAYAFGEALDLGGAKIKIATADGSTEVNVTLDMISGYNANTVGEQTITVTYEGVELTFKVTVVDAVKSVTLKSAPTKTEYNYGEELDLAGGKILIEMRSGKTETVNITAEMISEYDKTVLGEQTITVTYEGVELTFKVTVVDAVKSVTLKSAPTKTEYNYGEELDLTGAKLQVTTVSDATREVDVIAAMVSGYNKNTLGEQTLTVTYAEVELHFTVTVNDTVADVTLLSEPTKTEYNYGEELDPAGAKISVEMASGATRELDVTADMISGYDKNKEGRQRITVSYGGGYVMFFVTVTRDPIYVLPDNAKYAEELPLLRIGEELTVNLRGTATMSSNDPAVAAVEGNKITAVGFGSSLITVTEGDDSATFTLIVKRDYTGKTVTTQSQLTATQGGNRLYVYRMDNGDIETDLAEGLKGLILYEENGGAWWNGISFIGKDHFGGSGTGAIAYRASTAGNYTVDYSAWLVGEIRTNIPGNGYLDTDETDGFTTGIAKKSVDGTITVILSNIGNKLSVIEDATRYQMGTYTADLVRGEEIMVFFCSNGFGHSDEVYTDINFVTNSTVNTPLLVKPQFDSYAERLPVMTVGQEKTLTIRDCAIVTSGDDSVISVNGNKITALKYGVASITVSDDESGEEESETFTVVVKRASYDGMTVVSQDQLSKDTQGVNNLYAYHTPNGDIENDLENGLNELVLMFDHNDGGWYNGVSFIGPLHFGGRGTGAIAFRASATGSYTVDYSAYMMAHLHDNYLNSDVVDGFTTGIAVRKDGRVSVIVANVGTRTSVVAEATRYHSATYTTYLGKGDELIIFFCSNGNGDCDEVSTEMKFITNSTIDGDLYTLTGTGTVEDLPSLTIGQEATLTLRDGATVSSGNTAVATVEGNKITAVGYGSAIITVADEYETKSFVVIVKRNYDGLNVTSQSQLSSTTQGVNNLYVYRMDNGDIENDLQNSLQSLELYAEGDAWWNNISFIGNDHFGGSGTGAIAYKATAAGSYTVDYSAWLQTGIRKDANNGGYANWDVDGFTTGIAKKTADGITVIVSNIGTKQSILSDLTRYQTASYTTELKAGEELIVFFCSNGNGACDEVYTEINFIANTAINS